MADVSKIKVIDTEYDIKDATAVKYTEQELTEAQKENARLNIDTYSRTETDNAIAQKAQIQIITWGSDD